jgi:hypothetical protein
MLSSGFDVGVQDVAKLAHHGADLAGRSLGVGRPHRQPVQPLLVRACAQSASCGSGSRGGVGDA